MQSTNSTPPIGLNVAFDKSTLPNLDAGTAKLFVFIREPGKRMPLALEHYAIADIPQLVSFAGSSPQQTVELVARLSSSGKVEKAPNDIEIVKTLTMTHPPSTHTISFDGSEELAPQVALNTRVISDRKVATSSDARIKIEIDDSADLPSDATVYIVAKSKLRPIPLAVRRLSVADLPTQITLTDSDSMLPSHQLSNATTFQLSAHVSLGGTPSRDQGDWVSETIAYRGEDNVHDLVINSRID